MKKVISRLAFASTWVTPERIAHWLARQGRYSLIEAKPVLSEELVQDVYRDMRPTEWYWRISPAGLTFRQKNEDIMLSQMFVLVMTVDEQE